MKNVVWAQALRHGGRDLVCPFRQSPAVNQSLESLAWDKPDMRPAILTTFLREQSIFLTPCWIFYL